jgi:hypothetical protein
MTYPPLILGYTAHQRRPVVLDADASFPHRVLVGGTGKGKTSFLMGLVYQQLRRGGGCIFVDGKAKPQNLLTIAHLAQQTGRWSLLRAIAPGLPWSHLYNPLHAEREISEAVNFLLNLLPPVSVQSEAQYYRDQVRSFLLTTLEVLRATGKTATIRDLLAIMTAPAHVIEEKLRADLKDSRHEERFGDLHYITRGILKDKRETLSGMVAQLQSITATDLGNFLSTVFSDLDLTTAVDVGMPVWMALPTSSDQARANALGRAFLADILAVMADLTGDRRPTPTPPFLIVLDEFGSYALAEFAEMLRKAREANIQVVVSLTTIADLQDPTRGLTMSFPDQLLGNAEAIYMGSWAPGTLRYAAEYYGEEKQLIASRRESLAQNVSGRLASAEDRYWNPQLGTARTVFDQLTEKREPRLRKELLNELRQHEAIVFFQGHPTLVHLVYYFAPVTERNKDPATVVPTWLRAPLQPAGLSEYVLAHHVQIVKTAAANGKAPESATPPAKVTPARTTTPARKRTRPKPDAPPS